MYALYRLITLLASPFIPLWLAFRLSRGKENGVRLRERTGHAEKPRPDGKLVWIHAASVGEANAVLPLIDAILAASASVHVLLTTVTVTSAALMERRLPRRALHQFAPVDTPFAAARFLNHWRPEIALFVDSELWPNLLLAARRRGVTLGMVNARMSQRSFRRWSRMAPSLINRMLRCFTLCFAQTGLDGERLTALGIGKIHHIGNLKYDAPELPYDADELTRLQGLIGKRPLWLAASTHAGEETQIAAIHAALKAEGLGVLTILVPRHAARGAPIADQLRPLMVAWRSLNEAIRPETDIYLADTMGELGLFYRLSRIVFMGKSLAGGGGQNPLEAARMGCAILTGPDTENFSDVYEALQQVGACIKIPDQDALLARLRTLLSDPASVEALGTRARGCIQAHAGEVTVIMKELRPYLS